MDDPVAAVRALRENALAEKGTYDVPTNDFPADADDGWVAAGALARSPDGDRLVLVRTHWSGDGWVLPGGCVEPEDESLRATVRRELREETGLDVTVGEPLLVERQTLVDAATPSRRTTGWFVLFECTARGERFDRSPGAEEGEILDVAWFEDPDEALDAPSDNVSEAVLDAIR